MANIIIDPNKDRANEEHLDSLEHHFANMNYLSKNGTHITSKKEDGTTYVNARIYDQETADYNKELKKDITVVRNKTLSGYIRTLTVNEAPLVLHNLFKKELGIPLNKKLHRDDPEYKELKMKYLAHENGKYLIDNDGMKQKSIITLGSKK